MKLRNLRLAGKLSLGFGAVLAVVALSTAFTLVETRQVARIEHLNASSDLAVDEMTQAWGSMARAQATVRKYVLTGDNADKAKVEVAVAAFHAHLAAMREVLVVDAPEHIVALDAYGAKSDAYLDALILPELRLAADPATRAQAAALVGSPTNATASTEMDEALKTLEGRVRPWSDQLTVDGESAMGRIVQIVIVAGVASLVLGGLMAWLITRAIRRPLVAMTDAMTHLAAGDTAITVPALGRADEIGEMAAAVQVFKDAALAKLRLEAEAAASRRLAEDLREQDEATRAEVARQQAQVVGAVSQGLDKLHGGDLTFRIANALAPDYEKLRTDFNAAMGALEQVMGVVAANAAAIRSGTAEISAASDDLSRRTEQQAASLEETAAALDEITATVKRTATGAVEAHALVAAAAKDAERSGAVVNRAVEAMAVIEGSSQKIGHIIGVIDEIAFQTNLLALNAGVEAARAGDAGRGFAVVASEVRALAQRSAEAAKEIKGLISASADQVSGGVNLVNETGRALERIMAQVTTINGIVTDIAASAQEQSTGLDQVNTAINQMDGVTQQNAAMVEQSTAASKNLAHDADEMARLVGRFTVMPAASAGPGGARVATPRSTASRGALAVALEAGPAEWDDF